MQYIKLSNDSFAIATSQGMYTLTRQSFNFNKLQRLLKEETDEETVLELLQPVDTKEGVYELFLTALDILYYIHYVGTNTEVKILSDSSPDSPDCIVTPKVHKLLGVYTSKQDMIEDWPEYLL
jgi:hypothetical protein